MFLGSGKSEVGLWMYIFLVQQIILICFMGTFMYTSSLDPDNHLRVVLGSRLSPAHCAHSPSVGS